MGYLLLLLILELAGLYIISRRLTNRLFQTFLMLFKNRSIAVSAITILLFPGTVIHELSHLFTAEILGVRTGKLTLAPESIEGDDINVGSVEFQQTDPFRRSLIGLAPFIVGVIILCVLSYYFFIFSDGFLTDWQLLFSGTIDWLVVGLGIGILYVLFTISNTMFSSPEDMKGVIPLAVVLGLLGTLGYTLGIRIAITGVLEQKMTPVMSAISRSIGMVLLLNLFLYFITSAGIRIVKRIKGES